MRIKLRKNTFVIYQTNLKNRALSSALVEHRSNTVTNTTTNTARIFLFCQSLILLCTPSKRNLYIICVDNSSSYRKYTLLRFCQQKMRQLLFVVATFLFFFTIKVVRTGDANLFLALWDEVNSFVVLLLQFCFLFCKN